WRPTLLSWHPFQRALILPLLARDRLPAINTMTLVRRIPSLLSAIHAAAEPVHPHRPVEHCVTLCALLVGSKVGMRGDAIAIFRAAFFVANFALVGHFFTFAA